MSQQFSYQKQWLPQTKHSLKKSNKTPPPQKENMGESEFTAYFRKQNQNQNSSQNIKKIQVQLNQDSFQSQNQAQSMLSQKVSPLKNNSNILNNLNHSTTNNYNNNNNQSFQKQIMANKYISQNENENLNQKQNSHFLNQQFSSSKKKQRGGMYNNTSYNYNNNNNNITNSNNNNIVINNNNYETNQSNTTTQFNDSTVNIKNTTSPLLHDISSTYSNTQESQYNNLNMTQNNVLNQISSQNQDQEQQYKQQGYLQNNNSQLDISIQKKIYPSSVTPPPFKTRQKSLTKISGKQNNFEEYQKSQKCRINLSSIQKYGQFQSGSTSARENSLQKIKKKNNNTTVNFQQNSQIYLMEENLSEQIQGQESKSSQEEQAFQDIITDKTNKQQSKIQYPQTAQNSNSKQNSFSQKTLKPQKQSISITVGNKPYKRRLSQNSNNTPKVSIQKQLFTANNNNNNKNQNSFNNTINYKISQSNTQSHVSSNSLVVNNNNYRQSKISSGYTSSAHSRFNSTTNNKNQVNVASQQQQKEKIANIKTYARFRPYNKVEQELDTEGFVNQNVIEIESSTNVKIYQEKQEQGYQLTKVFPSHTPQEQIYSEVVSETVKEVLNGFNGTIFAYGPTGSGKTYTMFGDLLKNEQMGVIPRIADEIFNHINLQDNLGIEFQAKISMLEIYKENLQDLLHLQSSYNLKIKESPTNGIYVQGLSSIIVNNQQELLQYIQQGFNAKKTRETRFNEYSSRSHTIFQLEINQKIISSIEGSEKVGKLNLIDLAGSEKMSKQSTDGESVQETKKINLSLSCLGNVIHALATNQEHVPYRDSKLTRILQESLSGNYKTSLIVTCSQHCTMASETASALKFATRTKSIKLKFKQNIFTSSSNLQNAYEKLKIEINDKRIKFKQISEIISQHKEDQEQNKAIESLQLIEQAISQESSQVSSQYTYNNNQNNNIVFEDFQFNGCSNNNMTLNENQLQLQQQNQYSTNSSTQEIKQSEQIQEQLKQEIQNLNNIINDKNDLINNQEQELHQMREENLNLQQNISSLKEQMTEKEAYFSKELSRKEYNIFQIDVFQKQIQSLVEKLTDSESLTTTILKEKNQINEFKFEELKSNQGLKFRDIKISQYYLNNIEYFLDNWQIERQQENNVLDQLSEEESNMFNPMNSQNIKQQLQQSFFTNLENGMNSNNQEKYSFIKQIDFERDNNNMNNDIQNNNNIQKNNINKEFEQYQNKQMNIFNLEDNQFYLKKQLVESQIINQHLQRIINAFEWKQVIDFGKAKMKSNLIYLQQAHIQKLENVIEEVSKNYKYLKRKLQESALDQHIKSQQYYHHQQSTTQYGNNRKSIALEKNSMVSFLDQQNFNETQLRILEDDRQNTVGAKQWIEKHAKIVDNIDKELMPLSYQNAIQVLQKRNNFIKLLWQQLEQSTNQNEQNIQMVDEFNNFKQENERLSDTILSCQSELQLETVKANQYKEAFQAEKKVTRQLKILCQELESGLRKNLKEDNESWEKIVKTLKQQHQLEIVNNIQSVTDLNPQSLIHLLQNKLQQIQFDEQKYIPQEELINILNTVENLKCKLYM